MVNTFQDFLNEVSVIDFLYLIVTILSLIQCYRKGFVLSIATPTVE